MTEPSAPSGTLATDSLPPVVTTDGGPVTLADMPALKARAEAAQERVAALSIEASSLRELARNLWIQRGTILFSKINEWSPPAPLQAPIQEATALRQRVDADNSRLEAIHTEPHPGISGLVGKAAGWSQAQQVSHDRAGAEANLQPILLQIGQQAPDITVPDSDLVRSQARAAVAEAEQREAQTSEAAATVASTNAELQRRSVSQREMGFDALYLAAYLQTYGPQPIESPLVLKKGEIACLAVPATLARQQTRRQWVGRSSGFSFPIGHTGIRYRVGSFRGHPIEQQFMSKLGPGTLVVTNQRIAFVGQSKSVAIQLTKVMHVEAYTDAVAVLHEGKENADYFLTTTPKQTVFYINWALNSAAA